MHSHPRFTAPIRHTIPLSHDHCSPQYIHISKFNFASNSVMGKRVDFNMTFSLLWDTIAYYIGQRHTQRWLYYVALFCCAMICIKHMGVVNPYYYIIYANICMSSRTMYNDANPCWTQMYKGQWPHIILPVLSIAYTIPRWPMYHLEIHDRMPV